MKKVNQVYTTSKRWVKVKDLKVSDFLAKYGMSIVDDFIIRQLKKFGLGVGQVIVTKDNLVIHNAEALKEAKKLNLKEIDVIVINELDTDEIIQVTSFKNIGKKISRRSIAELILVLQEYITDNNKGIEWAKEVPGSKPNEKIGYLLGVSYGKIYSILDMYKYNTDLLDEIDAGDKKIGEAEEEIKEIKKKLSEEDSGSEDSGNACNGTQEDNSTDIGADDMVGQENKNEKSEEESEDDAPDSTSKEDNTTSVRVNRKTKWMYAGEKDMKPCRKISGITVRYESGKTEQIDISNGIACLKKNGIEVRKYNYKTGIYHKYDGSEFHCMNTENYNQTIQLIFTNNQNNKAA
ncbi:MAG: hypothetical protein KDE33_17690 [Bacteroidetes bacterium]|nr:hypothetical protein [Bacteroidota bacterium]